MGKSWLGFKALSKTAQSQATPHDEALSHRAEEIHGEHSSTLSSALAPTLDSRLEGVGTSGSHSSAPEGGSLKGYTALCRLSRFGANLADAHSCFIFFHGSAVRALDPGGPTIRSPDNLVLAGYHSLSPDILPHCEVSASNGLIGWVSSHGRSIHVSPFELDSRTLGIYSADQQLKSFIGIPIMLQDPCDMFGAAGVASNQLTGVLACDSKKSFAFSKLQGKLLEDLAREVANTVEMLVEQQGRAHPDVAWHSFLRRSSELARTVGIGSLEIVRVVASNFDRIERSIGTSAALTASEQLFRVIRQILPPHFPAVRLINGDILMAFDNMMTSFYESRIRAVSSHHQARTQAGSESLQFEFIKASGRDRKRRDIGVEYLVQMTSVERTYSGMNDRPNPTSTSQGDGSVVRLERAVGYGNSRA